MSIEALLRESRLLDDAALAAARAERDRTGERIDLAAVRLGLLQPGPLLAAIAEHFELPVVDLANLEPDPDTLRALPSRTVFRLQCAPIALSGRSLRVVTGDPATLGALDELRLATGRAVEIALADPRDVAKFIRRHYGVAGDTLDALSAGSSSPAEIPESAEDDAAAEEASVVRLVNDLLLEAIRERATDVHLEPYENELEVRYRIDGVLSLAGVPPTIHRFRNAIVSRLKIMANLNIAEKRKPQDGRITLRNRGQDRGQEWDLRLSIIPMLHGEGAVLRILSKSAVLTGLDELGMPPEILGRWDSLIARPHGILLVTGPTGSGKSTTLYASLARIVSDEVKAITVEDPVEYHLAGVNQIQVNHGVGLGFAAGLRAILRHDPDIIMIGEIRDRETAEAAVQASLTGHLVFSTLHTNDSAGAATRLLDMGIEPFLVASSLEGVMAQRLLRRLCPHCRVERGVPRPELPEDFPGDEPEVRLLEPVGCRECRQSGYRGRVGVYELLTLSPATRDLVLQRADARRLAARATADGDLHLLRTSAFAAVRNGVTGLSEALRATRSA
jgi:type II secretory ATPase GspE/PulE/Tfp pilus assembly ATPase PilB-like protein